MKSKKTYIYLAMLGLLSACKTAQPKANNLPTNPVSINEAKPTNTQNKAIYQSLLAETAKTQSFESLKISSKINVEMDKFVPSLNAQFYIENKQKIWVNVTALFMSFARALCTPQGLKAYEKLNSTYVDADYQLANDLLNVNFINYQVLQNILLGQSFLPISADNYELSVAPDTYVLKSKQPQIIENKGKKTALNISMVFSKDFRLMQSLVQEQNSPNHLSIDYQNWLQQQNDWFPRNLKISIKNDKNKVINIENTNFEFIKMETPYTVPNGYTKREF